MEDDETRSVRQQDEHVSQSKDGKIVTLASTGLFDEDMSKKLGEKDRETFHKFTAKGLFASKRARQDIAPVMSVLCTRVKSPGTTIGTSQCAI